MLLTARHCVSETASTVDCTTPVILGNYPLTELSVASSDGSQVWPATSVHYADEVTCDQGSFDTHVECTLCGYDVAVIEVGTPLTTTPFGIDWTAPTITESFDVLGLSCQNCSDAQAVMASNLTPSTVNGQEIFLSTNVCSGDSGAGLFQSGQTSVAGVLSRGNSACTEGAFERLDTLRPWLTGVGVESGDNPSWTGVEPVSDAETSEDASDAPAPAPTGHASGSSCSFSLTPPSDDGWLALGFSVLAGVGAVKRRRSCWHRESRLTTGLAKTT
jgi:hypothetical protein